MSWFDRWLLVVTFFLAYWFFGNLYEQVALVPNLLTDAGTRVAHYAGLFATTDPTLYFVPVTQLTVLGLLGLWWVARRTDRQAAMLGRAAVLAVSGVAVTAVIVVAVNLHLFDPAADVTDTARANLALAWLVANILRMALVGSATYWCVRVLAARHVDASRDVRPADQPRADPAAQSGPRQRREGTTGALMTGSLHRRIDRDHDEVPDRAWRRGGSPP